ncbi:MAG: hypothetical protein V1889_03640 [archaeon]
MILYFDNLITNIPLNPGIYTDLDAIRDSCKSYSTRDRYDVTLYTLASYAEIDWEEVVIVYEFGKDMVERKKEFEKFVKAFWPKAYLFYGRSDNQKKFQERLRFINKLKGDWIFYAGNNDHPFVAPNKNLLNSCLIKAKLLAKKNKYVSISFSHFWETYHMSKKGSAYRDYMSLRPKILEENDDYFICLFYEIWGHSMQIFNKKLMNYMLFSEDLGDGVFKKIEEITWHEKMKNKKINQISVIPKDVLCDHFDGYGHTKNSLFPVPTDIFPPLFIPSGFFENKIKIRYGYNDYKEGWVNVNPLIRKYKFQDKNGIDLKISIDEIPLFWEKRIKKVDVNPNLNEKLVNKKRGEIKRKMRDSYGPIKKRSCRYRLKYKIISGNYLPYCVVALLRKNWLIKKVRRRFFAKVKKELENNMKSF